MRDAKGFTLIELLVTVAIIGIIAAVAVPQYRQSVAKGNRAAAQAFMLDIANREKQFLLDARSYAGTLAALTMTQPTDVSKNYTITICLDAACTPATSVPSFKITATPIFGQAQASDGFLELNDTGAKCWSTNGACPNKW